MNTASNDKLRNRRAELVFLGLENTIEHDYAERAGISFHHVPFTGLRRHRSADNLAMPMPLAVARGVPAAFTALRRERPDAPFSMGSYVSVPFGVGALRKRYGVLHVVGKGNLAPSSPTAPGTGSWSTEFYQSLVPSGLRCRGLGPGR